MLAASWRRSEVLEFGLKNPSGAPCPCSLCARVLWWWHCLALIALSPCVPSPLVDSQASLSFMESQMLLFPWNRSSSMSAVREQDSPRLALGILGYPTPFILWMKWGWPFNPKCLCWDFSFTVSTHNNLSTGNRRGAGVPVRTDIGVKFYQSAVEGLTLVV